MSAVHDRISQAIDILNDAQGDIPDLIDQTSNLDSIADDVEQLLYLPVDELREAVEKIAGDIRDQAQAIRDEVDS